MHEELLQAGVGYLIAEGLSRLSGSPKDLEVQALIRKLTRAASWFLALLTSLGLSFVWDGSLVAGGMIGVRFPSGYDLMMAVAHVVGQGMFQEWRMAERGRTQSLEVVLAQLQQVLKAAAAPKSPEKE